jgi:hypothetical protein
MLRRVLGGLQLARLATTLVKTTVAAAAMAAVAWWVEAWLRSLMPGTTTALHALRVSVAIAVAIGVLSAVAWLVRLREFNEAFTMVVGRLRRLRR